MLREKLKKLYMFSSLQDEDLDLITSIVKVKDYDKGEMIFFDTEPYNGFYIVIHGSVKVFKISNDGREHILHIIDPGHSFAEVPLFENFENVLGDNVNYPANSMALESPTQVVRVPAVEFVNLLKNNIGICLKLLSGFAKRMRHLNRHIEDITLKDVTKRVAAYILTEYNSQKRDDFEIELSISKNDLASYLGTILETLSRTFKKLQEKELIEVDGRKIVIKNLEDLTKILY
jgi:CRP/FNR family transcriptional regulator, dissimilatory nitrate respiration regulator